MATRTTTTTTTIQPSLLLDCSVPIVSSNVDVPEVTMAAAERIPAQRSYTDKLSGAELRHHVLAGADIESLAGVQTKSQCPEPTTLKRRDLKKMQVRGVSGRK